MKRAALYARVSTLDQTTANQLYDLRQMAQQRGLEIIEEFVDHGISGARARRPALDKMMDEARRGRFDVVLVWACDRLARSVRHFLETLDELNRLNVEFISFREQLDTGGPLGRAFATRALEQCSTRREAVARHFVALATYMGHTDIAHTYWYLEATPELMTDIAAVAEALVAEEVR